MLPVSWYLLKVIICSGILFGYYWLFLRNKIFHQYNRFYLLACMVVSLVLPLFKINFWQPATQSGQAARALQVFSAGDEYVNSIVVTASHNSWSFAQLYVLLYGLVSAVFLFILIRTLYLIWSLLKKYPVQQIGTVSFVNTDHDKTPFSFLKYIFWNNSIDMGSSTGRQIFKHEVAHIQERHTYDKLFVNVCLLLCWCNPFFWLYRKELNMIHEFIADKKAVEDGDTAGFAAMILQAAYPRQRFELTNNFFYSPIKRRLLMLTKNKNSRSNYFGRIMVLPLFVLVFAAFSFKAKKADLLNANKITGIFSNTNDPVLTGKANAALPEVLPTVIMVPTSPDTLPVQAPIDPEKALLIVNGKIMGKGKSAADEFNNLVTESITVKWLQKKEAMAKYGADGADGACEVDYKDGAIFRTRFADSDNRSVFYIGIENPVQVSVANVNPADLVVNMSPGSISGSNGNYVARVSQVGEVMITLSKKDGTILPQKCTVKVKRLPDPSDPEFPGQLRLNLKIDSTKKLYDLKLKLLQEQKMGLQLNEAAYDLKLKTTNDLLLKQKLEAKLNHENLLQLKQQIVLNEQAKLNQELADKQRQLSSNMIFTRVEIEPEFAGGADAWKKYLREHVKPATPVEEGWSAGKYVVIVKFIVHTDGTVSDVTTENYQGSKTAQHCIAIIQNAPNWKPGIQNGRKVTAYKKQPITFLITE